DVPTKYYVQVTDGYKCVNKDSVFINVKQFVTLSAGNDTTICRGDIIKLNATGDALHYSWSPTSTLDNNIEENPLATPLTTTTYHVTGTIGKCVANDDVQIFVVPYPISFAGNDTAICFNSSATLHATGGTNYSWSPAISLSDPNNADPVANPVESVDYIVTVTDDKGCPKAVKDTVSVKVYPKIIANAGPRDTNIVINQPLQLHGSGGQVYLWLPATGLSDNHIENPVALLKDDQQYILKASIPAGCFGTDTINVKVYKTGPGLYVPNAFTPNGDGLNDIFRPVPLGMKYITYFKIYNRFGQLLFSTSRPGQGWDGTINGKLQNPDVYVWIAEGVNYLDKKVSVKGTVMLIR
ncbi:MAG: T9SS type B sorting domain-containing protein, partial [Ginsengibacter sp.]